MNAPSSTAPFPGVSEQFREEEENGLVVKLTAKTIEAAVLDDTKDLVILFHEQVLHPKQNIFKRMVSFPFLLRRFRSHLNVFVLLFLFLFFCSERAPKRART